MKFLSWIARNSDVLPVILLAMALAYPGAYFCEIHLLVKFILNHCDKKVYQVSAKHEWEWSYYRQHTNTHLTLSSPLYISYYLFALYCVQSASEMCKGIFNLRE